MTSSYIEELFMNSYIQTKMHTAHRIGLQLIHMHKLTGSLTTVRGRKMSGKGEMAGTLKEAVFRIVLYIAKLRDLGSNANIGMHFWSVTIT